MRPGLFLTTTHSDNVAIWDFPLVVAAILGLVSTVHCVGMCGGIVGMLTMSLPAEVRQNRVQLLSYTLSYNVGRVVSYTLAGVAAGALSGSVFDPESAREGPSVARIVAPLLVVAIGLYLAGWLPRWTMLERIGAPLWRAIEPYGKRLLPIRTLPKALMFGMVWGWLPCSPVYSALALSLTTGSALGGGLFMLVFGIGTLPTLMTAGFLAGLATRIRRFRHLNKLAGASLVVMGLIGLVLGTVPHVHEHVHHEGLQQEIQRNR
jgi:sulfite exporter TauE/SafE